MAGTMALTVPPNFFEDLRRQTVRNVVGYLPVLDARGAVVSPVHSSSHGKPVVTYISRQGGGRRLRQEDHESLVKALEALQNEGDFEVQIVRMEEFSLRQQVEVVARSAVSVLLPLDSHILMR